MTAYRLLPYAVLLLLVVGMIAAAASLYENRASKDGTFIVRDGELVRKAEIRLLDPLLDIKTRILADYPVSILNRSRDKDIQQVNDLETLRAVYYNLFIQSDWSEIKKLFNAIKANKSLDLKNNNQYVGPIVEMLDSTILAAAYFYERLNMNDAASYYYSLYLDCLRPVSFSSPGSIDRMLGRRLMVSRLKYYYLRDYARYMAPEYARHSYLNWILDDTLYFMSTYYRFKRYWSIVEVDSFTDGDFLDLIQRSDSRALPFLKYERCIALIRQSDWSEDAAKTLNDVCAVAPLATKDDYLASFTSAAHIFFRVRWYLAETEKTGAPDASKFAEIERAMKTFYDRHAKEADFLVDDMKIKYAMLPGNAKERDRTLCDVAKFPYPNYDFAPYAGSLVKEMGIKCD